MVEILVAMLVLAIGLLGMAAMTILVMKGSRGASDLTAATNICQLKMEELKDVAWTDLGSAHVTDITATQALDGLMNGDMFQETGLNSLGNSTGDGPFKFTRTFVIRKGDDYTPGATTSDPPVIPPNTDVGASASPATTESPQAKDCSVDPTKGRPPGSANPTRVQWLACSQNDITSPPPATPGLPAGTNPEKKLKVLCTWRSRDGECHSVHIDTTVVKLRS